VILSRDLQKRLEDLERGRHVHGESEEEDRQFVRAFLAATCKAISHVRRQPIDSPALQYSIDKLHALKPHHLAGYVAALRLQEHPDEDEARDLLRGLPGEERLIRLIDALADRVRSGF